MTGIHEVPDERAARRRSRGLVGAYVGLIVVAGAIGGVVGATRHHHHHTHPLHGLLVLGGVLLVVAALGGTLLWFMISRPHTQRLMAYGWRRRFRVAKQLRRGQQVTDEDWPLAAAIEEGVRRQWWAPVFWALLIVLEASNAVTRHGFARSFYAVAAVVFCLFLPYAVWERRRVRAGFLRERSRRSEPTR